MPEHTPAPTPSRAVYGFVLFLGCKTLFLLYIVWAIVPENWFEHINITYLPQRYWAVTIPILLLTILATFGFVIYPSLNFCMTPNVDDLRTVLDNSIHQEISNVCLDGLKNLNYEDCVGDKECICKFDTKCSKDEFTKCYKNSMRYHIPMVEDLCIADVSRTLYLK